MGSPASVISSSTLSVDPEAPAGDGLPLPKPDGEGFLLAPTVRHLLGSIPTDSGPTADLNHADIARLWFFLTSQ